MDSMGKISKDLRAWSNNSGMTVPNEYADRIDALMKEYVVEVIAHDTAADVWWQKPTYDLPIGTKLFSAPPAPAVLKVETLLANLLTHVDASICLHESTHRGGAIWTICDDCGRKWADDHGGFKPHKDDPAVASARAYIDSAMKASPEPKEQT